MALRQFQAEKASNLFTVMAYSPNDQLFLCKDKSLAFSFLCIPLSGVDQKTFERFAVQIGLEWPNNTMLSYSLIGSPNLNKQLHHSMSIREDAVQLFADHEKYKQLFGIAKERVDFIKRSTKEPILEQFDLKVRDILLVVSVKIPLAAERPTEEEYKKVNELKISLEASLKTSGVYPTIMDNQAYLDVLKPFFNWGQEATWKDELTSNIDGEQVLSSQLLDYDSFIEWDSKSVYMRNSDLSNNNETMHCKVLSVKRHPELAYFGIALSYIGDIMSGQRGIRENFILTSNILLPDYDTIKQSINKKRNFAVNQAQGTLVRFIPQLIERRDNFDVLFKHLNDGERACQMSMTLCIFSDSEEAAIASVSNARSYMRELGFQMVEDRFIALPLLINALPMGADLDAVQDSMRYKTMSAKQAVALVPIMSEWRGTQTPIINLISRSGQYMNLSPYDTRNNNNILIAAESGSGKSVLANELAVNLLSVGGKVWIIDVGKSYKKVCLLLGGDYIEFDEKSNICLNPFPLVENYKEESDGLVGLVAAMAAPTIPLTDLQMAALKEVMMTLWKEKGKSLCIDDIAVSLKADADKVVQDIGRQLYAFTTAGEYGSFFNGDNNVSFKNSFCVLELEELKGRPHLQKVVLLQIMYHIQQDMYLGKKKNPDDSRPKMVLIDECWEFLGGGGDSEHSEVAQFLNHAYRRFRKYGGCAAICVQSILDVWESSAGRAIAENSSHYYLLSQQDQSIKALQEQKRLPLSDGGYKLFESVMSAPPLYSEILALTPFGQGIGRLILDPAKQLLYSTKDDDVTAISRYQSQGMNVSDAIHAVLRDRNIKPSKTG